MDDLLFINGNVFRLQINLIQFREQIPLYPGGQRLMGITKGDSRLSYEIN